MSNGLYPMMHFLQMDKHQMQISEETNKKMIYDFVLNLVKGNVEVFDVQHYALMQVVSLTVETLVWCSLVIMTLLETKVYIREFRWYVRFGVIYVLVGDTVKLSFILSLKDLYPRSVSLPLPVSTTYICSFNQMYVSCLYA